MAPTSIFFKFDGTSKPFSFLRGAFPGDPPSLRRGFELPGLTTAEESALPFMRALHLISEVIFNLLLSGYVSSIGAFRDRYSVRGTKEHPRQSLTKWDDALASAKQTLDHYRDAESKRHDGDITTANKAVSQARTLLKHR